MRVVIGVATPATQAHALLAASDHPTFVRSEALANPESGTTCPQPGPPEPRGRGVKNAGGKAR